MKYQCDDCKRIFSHPAKLLEHRANELLLKGTVVVPETGDYVETEFSVCPFCKNSAFTEYVEPQPEIESVKSVDLAQVDEYLKQGYIVKELYAKTATLIKCKQATTAFEGPQL